MLFSNTALACGFICENSIADKNRGKFGENLEGRQTILLLFSVKKPAAVLPLP